jgi:hypothetical protein
MPVVTIRHTTVYRYAAPVTFGDHRLMFRPRDSHDLRLLETGLQINPPANVRWLHDVFGNSIAVASFLEPAPELQLISTIRLEHFPGIALEFPLEPYARHHPFSYSAEEVPDLGRTMERHYPDPDHRIDERAHRFIAGPGETDTQALLVSSPPPSARSFATTEAEGTQTPIETLDRASGTCRDSALFTWRPRSLAFAARRLRHLYDDAPSEAVHARVGADLPAGRRLGRVRSDERADRRPELVRVAVTRPEPGDPRRRDVDGRAVRLPRHDRRRRRCPAAEERPRTIGSTIARATTTLSTRTTTRTCASVELVHGSRRAGRSAQAGRTGDPPAGGAGRPRRVHRDGARLLDTMLAEAQRKLAQTPARERNVVVQGTCGLGGARAVDSSCRLSVCHLLVDDQLAVWDWHANLVSGGRFVVDVVMPDLVVYADSLRQRRARW